MSNIASGLGSTLGVGAQGTYGGALATISRWPTYKTADSTYDPHVVQGGPYLRGASAGGDVGSARVLLTPQVSSTSGPFAKGTIQGDFVNTGMALLLACGFGTSATLTALGTTSAYGLGGAGGFTLSDPVVNSTFFDMQWGVMSTDGTQNPITFHSCIITDITLTFDRMGLVTYEYGFDAQFVETTTVLTAVTEPNGFVPFAMQNSSCLFKAGTLGGEAAVDGAKKAVFKASRKQAVDRLYLGNLTKDVPTTIDNWKVTLAIDFDYTSQAKTYFGYFSSGVAKSFILTSSGNAIASTGYNDLLTVNPTYCFVDSGGEANPKGPGLVGNTLNLSATVDPSADAQVKGTYQTADTTF